jgi:hypothetical protein
MGKTALITGATSGIGAAYAKKLASQGYDLILTGRRREVIQKLADKLAKQFNVNIKVILAELSNDSDIRKVVNAINNAENLEMLINNAGYNGPLIPFAERDLSEQEKMVKVLTTSPMRLTYAVLPEMIKKGQGTIINVSSIAAYLPSKKWAVYAASKAFLKSFTEALYLEVKNQGVKVQVVCPGNTDTDFFRDFSTDGKSTWLNVFKVVMSPEEVVDHSLKDLEKNIVVCIPGEYYKGVLKLFSVLPPPDMYEKAEKGATY